MDNNMKYIKLYENFQGGKPISNKDWKKFEKVNKKIHFIPTWKKNIFEYNVFGSLDYLGSLIPMASGKGGIDKVTDLIPVYVNRVLGDLKISNHHFQTMEGLPKYVSRDFEFNYNMIRSLYKGVEYVGRDFNVNYNSLFCLKYLPEVKGEVSWSFNPLFSDINDYGYKDKDWEGYNKEKCKISMSDWSKPYLFEALAYVGARDPEAYAQVCKDFPEETTFTPEQVEEYLNSPLIDRKSTEEDWKIANGLLDRTKSYDHSEYRDSKLDSEWKEIF